MHRGCPDATRTCTYVTNHPTMLTDPFGLEPAGCRPLGRGCIVDPFGRVFGSLVQAARRAVTEVRQCFFYLVQCVESVKLLVGGAAVFSAGVLAIVAGVWICFQTGPLGCATGGALLFTAGVATIWAGVQVAKEYWSRRHEFFHY